MTSLHPTELSPTGLNPTGLERLLRRRRSRRGFTLIELAMSMVAGLIVSAAAFLMARNATKFFQQEASITSAQYGATLGLSRLQQDLRRAAFMSTSNVDRDPRLCGRPAGITTGTPAGYTVLMQELGGVFIVQDGSMTAHGPGLWDDNGLSPDALVITGTFDTTEQFVVQTLVPAGGGAFDVVLADNTTDGAMARTEAAILGGASPPFSQIFRPGRLLRLIDNEGRFSLGVIAGVDPGPPNVVISLEAAPALATRDTAVNCGCEGFCVGTLVNPIARMLYDLRDVQNQANYAGMFQDATHGAAAYHRGSAANPNRTELIRVELDQLAVSALDAEITTVNGYAEDTLEVLSEYAVDLKFGIVAEDATIPVPNFTRFDINDGGQYAIANGLGAAPVGRPDRVRAVQVRLSTRAPRRDRDEPLNAAADGGLFRFNLGPGEGYARMRTLIADVQLPNHTGGFTP